MRLLSIYLLIIVITPGVTLAQGTPRTHAATVAARSRASVEATTVVQDTVPIRRRVDVVSVRDRRTFISSVNRDTIPIGRYKYFRVDSAKYRIYLNSAINKDSVKLAKASTGDWAEFTMAYDSLRLTLIINPNNNVQNYIDSANDFRELTLLNETRLPHTAKVCLRQLTFNIRLLNQLLRKQIDKEDLVLLNNIMGNIQTLVSAYIAPIGYTFMLADIGLFNVRLRVFDRDRTTELTNAQCYFLSNHSCRDIACMTCLPGMDPCDAGNINAIVGQSDIRYDCANPTGIRIGFGHYHVFVITNGRIVYADLKHFDENSITTADNHEIKFFLQ